MNKLICAMSLSCLLVLTGCANMTPTEKRTLAGTTIGVVAGTAIGAASGGSVLAGAAIGGLAGAGTGLLVDHSKQHHGSE